MNKLVCIFFICILFSCEKKEETFTTQITTVSDSTTIADLGPQESDSITKTGLVQEELDPTLNEYELNYIVSIAEGYNYTQLKKVAIDASTFCIFHLIL